jgi:hypothetical protein
MNEVNAKLYDFMKEHECQLYIQNFDKNKTVYAIVFISFYDLNDFVDAVGTYRFEEGGIQVNMQSEYIVVELNDFIESHGHSLSSYRNCFDDYEWNRYEEEIKIMEEFYN